MSFIEYAQICIRGEGWIKTFSIDEAVYAFNRMLAAEKDDIKTIITFD